MPVSLSSTDAPVQGISIWSRILLAILKALFVMGRETRKMVGYYEAVSEPLEIADARALAVRSVGEAASKHLIILLERKHLYQRISYNPKAELDELVARVHPNLKQTFLEFISVRGLEGQGLSLGSQNIIQLDGDGSSTAVLLVGNVKLFCSRCDELQMFGAVWMNEITQGLRKLHPPIEKAIQVFGLAYRCLRCFNQPEIFIVKRNGWHLSIEGRSPMESILVRDVVPKKEAEFFKDAIIFRNAGKSLAALFYLRTFLEQFARRQTVADAGVRITGEDLMDAYGRTLPIEQRSFMPSFRDWYEKLSAAIHEARADEKLFEDAREAIEHHLDIRRVFKMPDGPNAAT